MIAAASFDLFWLGGAAVAALVLILWSGGK